MTYMRHIRKIREGKKLIHARSAHKGSKGLNE